MEILSCSLLVCCVLSAQWRSVGAVASERVVASFLCSRLCVLHVHTSVDVHLDSCDRTQPVSFKTVISTAPSSTQQDKLRKICMDAGFLNVVEIGQYFMTKDTVEFLQFTDAVACREYTLPRDEETSEPKGWIRGNTKIGPVLEVTTCCLQS